MAHYDVTFSCGHTERKELFGPTKDRERRIKYWEECGICTECWREQKAMEDSIGCNEIEMHYGEYKEKHPKCKTKPGSYNGATKTIVVYVPKKAAGE